LVESAAGDHAVMNDAQKTAIHEQLGRLLENPYFSHSRRFPSFLRFTVDHALSGQTDRLKERTLGIEIFGRQADYDTASDPIVRVTAAEIRKRIAQYYQEPGHENELRISLPSGSYIPQFYWPSEKSPDSVPQLQLDKDSNSLSTQQPEQSKHPLSPDRKWPVIGIAAAVVVVVLLLLAGADFWRYTRHSAFDFWAPVLQSSDPVLFCVADQNQYSAIALRDAANPTRQVVLKDNVTALVLTDLRPIVKIAGILESKGKKYSLRGEGATDLADLRNGPTIFIGAFDNAWTLRLTKPLRYHFFNNEDMTDLGIVDSNSTSQAPLWVVNRSQQLATNNYRDYAIVARFVDNTTGRLTIVAAGVGRGGTIVAGEFLTDPEEQAQLTNAIRQAGSKKNIEIVLSTQIIDGEPGTPKIEATYSW